jgi:OOP family OmpA-OmpF porin
MPLNVKFDTAKSDIKKKYDNDIKKVADFMKANPEATAVIEGHTDNVDIHNEPERNMRLSQARADSVRQYLIDTFGIDASRITAVGYGPNKPIASNDTTEGKQKNRRIEAVIEMVKTK